MVPLRLVLSSPNRDLGSDRRSPAAEAPAGNNPRDSQRTRHSMPSLTSQSHAMLLKLCFRSVIAAAILPVIRQSPCLEHRIQIHLQPLTALRSLRSAAVSCPAPHEAGSSLFCCSSFCELRLHILEFRLARRRVLLQTHDGVSLFDLNQSLTSPGFIASSAFTTCGASSSTGTGLCWPIITR